MKHLHAYTVPNVMFPAYVNLSERATDGKLFLSVRSDGAQYASVMELPEEEAVKLAEAILARCKVPA